MLLQGGKDDVVPLFSQAELFNSYSSAKYKVVDVIEGANHQFSAILGKNRKLAIKLYAERIVNFLKK